MIDVKELRIGNLIWNPVQKCAVDVTLRELRQIEFENKYNQNSTDINFKWQPIPLTEEWLIKLGFEGLSKKNEYFELIHNDTIGYRLSIEGQYGFCEIEYVHQLQNLYYELMRKELTINL